MTIHHHTWRRFTRVGIILALPVVLFLFISPDWGAWSHRLKIVAYIFLFLLGGTGALLAILTRAGVVRLIYSEADKQSMGYKMSKLVAETEQSQQREFSDSYYENLGVKPPKKSDDKPAA